MKKPNFDPTRQLGSPFAPIRVIRGLPPANYWARVTADRAAQAPAIFDYD